MTVKQRKASALGLDSHEVIVPVAFFSILYMQAALLKLIEDLRDDFSL